MSEEPTTEKRKPTPAERAAARRAKILAGGENRMNYVFGTSKEVESTAAFVASNDINGEEAPIPINEPIPSTSESTSSVSSSSLTPSPTQQQDCTTEEKGNSKLPLCCQPLPVQPDKFPDEHVQQGESFLPSPSTATSFSSFTLQKNTLYYDRIEWLTHTFGALALGIFFSFDVKLVQQVPLLLQFLDLRIIDDLKFLHLYIFTCWQLIVWSSMYLMRYSNEQALVRETVSCCQSFESLSLLLYAYVSLAFIFLNSIIIVCRSLFVVARSLYARTVTSRKHSSNFFDD